MPRTCQYLLPIRGFQHVSTINIGVKYHPKCWKWHRWPALFHSWVVAVLQSAWSLESRMMMDDVNALGITSPTPSADGVLDLCQQPRSADMTASSMISHCENSFQIANFLMSNADLSEKPLDELPSAKLFESVQLFSPNCSSFASGIWWLWYTDVDSHRVISCYIPYYGGSNHAYTAIDSIDLKCTCSDRIQGCH